MKKARKLGLQSLALVLMAFVLVAGVAFGMTGAWFTDKAQVDDVKITMGNAVAIQSVSLSFTAGEGEEYDQYGNAYTSGTKYYFPGQTLNAAGNITMANTSANAKLRVTLTQTGTITGISFATLKLNNVAFVPATVEDEDYLQAVAYITFENDDDPQYVFAFSGAIELSSELTETVAAQDVEFDLLVEAAQDANTGAENNATAWTTIGTVHVRAGA